MEARAYVFCALFLALSGGALGAGLLTRMFGIATLALFLAGIATACYVVLAAMDDILFKRAPKPDGTPVEEDTPLRAQDGWHARDADRGEREGIYQPGPLDV